MFDAALTFWAIVKFGVGIGGLSDSPGGTTVTCKLHYSSMSYTDEVQGRTPTKFIVGLKTVAE